MNEKEEIPFRGFNMTSNGRSQAPILSCGLGISRLIEISCFDFGIFLRWVRSEDKTIWQADSECV